MATDTLDELHQQGEQADRVSNNIQDIDSDVKEAKSILRYMRRCCLCFLCSCCCECDPDAERDAQRRQRVKERERMRQAELELAKMERQRTLEQRSKQANGSARQNLLKGSQRRQQPDIDTFAHQIGDGLAEADKEEIQHQARLQDEAIDGIDAVLDDLKDIGTQLGEELDEQNRRVGAVGDHAETVHDNIRKTQRKARTDFSLRVK